MPGYLHREPPRTGYDRFIIVGLPLIAEYMGVSRRTLQRWMVKYGAVGGKLPQGQWIASNRMIRLWLLERQHIPYLANKIKRVLSKI